LLIINFLRLYIYTILRLKKSNETYVFDNQKIKYRVSLLINCCQIICQEQNSCQYLFHLIFLEERYEEKNTIIRIGFYSLYPCEQNYRFSFNRAALANPRIVEELTISGFIGGADLPQMRTLGFTLFSPHNLTGSLDTVMSYNVELAGGDGYYR